MRPWTISPAAALAACLLASQAGAQTGPRAPGAELLPPHLQHWAETPLVLTSAAAPDKCLGMSDQEPAARTLHMWTCAPRATQKVWIDPVAQAGGETFRIRIGELACLVDSDRRGARAAMGICGDAAAAERWTVRDGQIAGSSGQCLDAGTPGDGTPVVTAACDAASASQQWRLEGMRVALSRLPPARFDPSGLGEFFNYGYLPYVVEEFRPRFTARELTPAERAEIRKLTAPWKHSSALDAQINAYKGASRTKVNIPWSTLRRLSELGETGDRDAMGAALEAFVLVSSTNYPDTFAGWDASAFPHADDPQLSWHVANGLAKLWAAHYWQRHGADRLAAIAFTSCHPDDEDSCMGYKGTLEHLKPTSNIFEWIKTGKSKFAIEVKDITFHPAAGTYEDRQKRFISILNGRAFTSISAFNSYGIYDRALMAVFADMTGQQALWDNVRLNSTFDYQGHTPQERHMRAELKSRADTAAWRARFEAFMAAPDPLQEWGIERGLAAQGDADLLRYAARHTVKDEALSARLCANGRDQLPGCLRSRQYIAQRRAEYDQAIAEARVEAARREAQAQADAEAAARKQAAHDRWLVANSRKPDFWDQLAGLAEGFAAAAEAGNRQVDVRVYDSAGNLVGTRTMTRSRAMGLGAKTKD